MPKLSTSNKPAHIRNKENKEKYENKRTIKNVSFNDESEGQLLDLTKRFKFSEWVKKILRAFSAYEVNQLIKGEVTIPSSLIEEAIENGQFDIDAYLDSKGYESVPKREFKASNQHNDPYSQLENEYEFNQDVTYFQEVHTQ